MHGVGCEGLDEEGYDHMQTVIQPTYVSQPSERIVSLPRDYKSLLVKVKLKANKLVEPGRILRWVVYP